MVIDPMSRGMDPSRLTMGCPEKTTESPSTATSAASR